MINKLYIRKNIKQNISKYVNIILIITISIIIINVLNIYLDSVIYGNKLRSLEISKGYHIWLKGTTEEDLTYFENIPGTEVKYEDNIIYIKILNKYDDEKIHNTVNQIIRDNNIPTMISSYSDILNKTSVPIEEFITFYVLKIIFTVIGTISIYFIYLIFIENKKKDLGILISLGMSNKQLKKLLFTELFIIYSFSFIAALIISNLLMHFIIQKFLSVYNDFFILIIYKFSFPSTLFLFFISFLSIITAFIIAMIKIINNPTVRTINDSSVPSRIKRNINIWNKSSAVKYIAKANLRRNKHHFFMCSVISVPVICICIFFLNYNNLVNMPISEYDFIINNNYLEIYNNSEMILENIEKLKSIDGIKSIEYETFFNNFFIKLDKSKINLKVYANINGIVYSQVSLNILSDYYINENDLSTVSNDYKSENYVVLPKNIDSSKYKSGDNMFLYNPANLQDSAEDDGGITLTIAGFIDVQQHGNLFNIYVTKENFEKLIGQTAVPNYINVIFDENADASAIKEEIHTIFNDENLFSFIDINENKIDEIKLYQGMTILILLLCSILFVCAIILLWSFIVYYISNQKQQINTLKLLGATKKTIMKTAVYEALTKGIINCLTGILIGTYISYKVIKMSGYDLIINNYFFIIYASVIIITISAHLIPSLMTTRNIITKKENE